MSTETPIEPLESTIAELYHRDPLKLSDQDFNRIIERLHAQRARYVQGNMTAGKPEAKKSAAQKKREATARALGPVDLSALGL